MVPTPAALHILILTDSDQTAAALASLLADYGFETETARTAFGEAVRAVSEHRPQFALIADTLDDPAAVVEALDAAAPDLPLLALLPEGDVEGAQACILAGARVTLLRPVEPQRLADTIWHMHTRETRRRQRLSPGEPLTAPGQQARIVAVHGAKGGVGATTLACNLAAALRQSTGQRVALVDADFEHGDAGVLCDLSPTTSIADLLSEQRALDTQTIDGLLPEHPTGLRVLLAPDSPQQAQGIGPEEVQRTLRILAPHFEYVVLDTPARGGPVPLAAFEAADLIVLVITPELLALRNAARFLRLAGQLGFPGEKILLVGNRIDTGRDITPAVVEQQLQRPLRAGLPADEGALLDCMNAGQLLVAARPRTKLAQAIARLAQDLVGALAPPAPAVD